MHRLLIALLAALDAVIAAASGIAVVLAPLTLLWVFGLGGGADWAALWPASGTIWQLGHLVPLAVTLPDTYLVAAGVDPAAASFTLSLAPLALAASTALFAARSGRRAAEAGAPGTGVLIGTVVFAAIAGAVFLTAGVPVVAAVAWQGILLPSLVFAVPAVLGAIAGAWRFETPGPVARLRGWANRLPGAWGAVPELLARGTAIAVTGLVGVGALVAGAAVFVRGGQVVALFEAAHVDVIGAIVIALAQLAYVPTLVVWGLSFTAGPGFAFGTDTAVSPAGTQVGVVPGIPVLGAIPESTSSWLLLLVLLPIAVGVLTGWMLRSRLAALPPGLRAHADGGTSVRLALALGVAVLTGGAAALLAAVASGSIGPGRLAAVGPHPGPLALSVGVEIFVGAAILLLAPRRRDDSSDGFGEPIETGREADSHAALWRSISAPPMYVHAGHDTEADDADADEPGASDERAPGFSDASAFEESRLPGSVGDVGEPDADTGPVDVAPFAPWVAPSPEEPDAAWSAEDAAWFAEGSMTPDDDERTSGNETEPLPGFERGRDEPPGDGRRPGSSVD